MVSDALLAQGHPIIAGAVMVLVTDRMAAASIIYLLAVALSFTPSTLRPQPRKMAVVGRRMLAAIQEVRL